MGIPFHPNLFYIYFTTIGEHLCLSILIYFHHNIFPQWLNLTLRLWRPGGFAARQLFAEKTRVLSSQLTLLIIIIIYLLMLIIIVICRLKLCCRYVAFALFFIVFGLAVIAAVNNLIMSLLPGVVMCYNGLGIDVELPESGSPTNLGCQ